jgi:hypothetical protein
MLEEIRKLGFVFMISLRLYTLALGTIAVALATNAALG